MPKAKFFDDKKFMWDGKTYDTESQAQEILKNYEKDGFEVRMAQEEDKYLIFTRRVVKEIILEGQAPV